MSSGNTDGSLYHGWHVAALGTVAGTQNGLVDAVFVPSVSRQHLGYPLWVIIADISQMTGHREYEIVARAVDWDTSELIGKAID